MKTTRTMPTYSISITEIAPDFDDSSRLEIYFTARLYRAYLETTELHDSDPTITDDLLYSDDHVTYRFNVASRHRDSLYATIINDHSGDSYDYEIAIAAFGQPVIDFIADACQLLNIPFYPEND